MNNYELLNMFTHIKDHICEIELFKDELIHLEGSREEIKTLIEHTLSSITALYDYINHLEGAIESEDNITLTLYSDMDTIVNESVSEYLQEFIDKYGILALGRLCDHLGAHQTISIKQNRSNNTIELTPISKQK